LDIRQLRYFESVARLGSFTQAAARLAVAQPALGVQIRKLEGELETQLFVRSSRGAELTEAGQELLKAARRILADVEAAKNSICDLNGPLRGYLRVGLPSSISALLAIRVMEIARETLPRVKLSLMESRSGELVDALIDERLDVALAFDVQAAIGISRRPLLQDEAALIEPLSPDVGHGPIDFADALVRPLILPSSPHRLRVLVDQQAARLRIKPAVVSEVQWPTTALRLVAQSFGATIMSQVVAQSYSIPNLAFRPIVRPKLRYPLYLVRRTGGPLLRPEKAMHQILERVVAEMYRLKPSVLTKAAGSQI